jgi:hypothetical protein
MLKYLRKGESSMGAIDVWAQITTARMAERPWLATLLRWTGREGEYLLPTVESTLQAMNAADVDVSCCQPGTARRAA